MTALEGGPLWRAYLVVGVTGALLLPLVAQWGLNDPWWMSFASLGLLGIGLGIWRNCRRHPVPWLLLGLFMAFQVGGGMIQANTDKSGDFGNDLSPADLCFVLSYLFAALGLGLLIRGTRGIVLRAGAVDAGIVLIGLSLVGWQFLLQPTLDSIPLAPGNAPQLLRVWYPLASYVLLALLVWLSSAEAIEGPAFQLLAVGLSIWSLAESSFHLTTLSLDVPKDWNLMLWLLGYVLIGAAVLHPSIITFHADRSGTQDKLRGRLVFLAVALCCVPLTLWAQVGGWNATAQFGLVLACAVMTLLVWLRFNILYQRLIGLTGELARLAETDFVTQVANRRAFDGALEAWFRRRWPPTMGLLLISVGSKTLQTHRNSSQVDAAVRDAAQRLAPCLQAGDTLARTGDTEFALLRPGASCLEDMVALAWTAQNRLTSATASNELPTQSSLHAAMGVAYAPADASSASAFFDLAHEAMHRADQGGTRVETVADAAPAASRLAWGQASGGKADDTRALHLHFQPVVSVTTRRVVELEALLRWQHPTEGLLMPASFLADWSRPAAAQTLMEWVIDKAVEECARWHLDGLQMGVSINVPHASVSIAALDAAIAKAMARHRLPSGRIALEWNEDRFLALATENPAHLHALRDRGVRLCVDDFGQRLDRLPTLVASLVHTLKIERQYVSESRANPVSAAIAQAVAGLGRVLPLQVVAKGVENQADSDALSGWGCDFLQGHWISPAVPAADIADMVHRVERQFAP